VDNFVEWGDAMLATNPCIVDALTGKTVVSIRASDTPGQRQHSENEVHAAFLENRVDVILSVFSPVCQELALSRARSTSISGSPATAMSTLFLYV
jgi:hypothetical protein